MAKKIEAYIKLQVPAGQANPSPPVGPALGQYGVNIREFTKVFNAQTEQIDKGLPLPVVITVYGDRSFTFIIEDTVKAQYSDEIISANAKASPAMNGEWLVVYFNASTVDGSQAAVNAFLTGTSDNQPAVLQQGINVLPDGDGHPIWSGMIARIVMLHLEISGSVVYSQEVPFCSCPQTTPPTIRCSPWQGRA